MRLSRAVSADGAGGLRLGVQGGLLVAALRAWRCRSRKHPHLSIRASARCLICVSHDCGIEFVRYIMDKQITEFYRVQTNTHSLVTCDKLEHALEAAYPAAQGHALAFKGEPVTVYAVPPSKGREVVDFLIREDRFVIRDSRPEERERIEAWWESSSRIKCLQEAKRKWEKEHERLGLRDEEDNSPEDP